MKTATKIYLVIIILFLSFFGALLVWRIHKEQSEKLFNESIKQADLEYFRRTNELIQQKTTKALLDNSTWDETIQYINTPTKKFEAECINSLLPTFEIDYIWVFDKQGRNIYYVRDSSNVPFEYLVDGATIQRLLTPKAPFCNFFYEKSGELFEIFGATVTTTFDINHKEEPKGYMFYGQKWDSNYLHLYEHVTGSKLELILGDSISDGEAPKDQTISYEELKNIHGETIARIKIMGDMKFQNQWDTEFNFALWMNILIWSIGIIIIGIILRRLVSKPLSRIMIALNNGNEKALKPLQKKQDEFGKISNLLAETIQLKRELEKSEKHLRELNSMKDKFFSIIAHDLRSPFSIFLNMTKVIEENYQTMTKDEIVEFNKSMGNSASNLFQLLENLLEWAQIQKGIIPFHPQPFRMKPLILSALDLIKQQITGKNLSLKLDIPEDTVVYADERMVDTIIRNLLTNAIKFTPKSGQIAIQLVELDTTKATISIQDSGIGMSPYIVEHLFHIDVNTSRYGTQGEPSSGLGLILCKEFIEKNQGTLLVESEEGKGTKVTFTFPLA